MKTEDEKKQVMFLRQEGWSYQRVSNKMNISKDSMRGICLQRKVIKPMKRGPRLKINSAYKLRLKRIICYLNQICENVNLCDIPVLRHTVARYLKQEGMKYKKVRSLPFKPLDKLRRDDLAKKWLAENHPWE